MNLMRSARIRSTVVTLTVGALVAIGAGVLAPRGAPATSPAAFTSGVEDDGASCPVTLPGSLTSNSQLPDPFTRIDGSRIATTSDWTCRREEIVQLAEKYVYGSKPAKPASVSGTVTGSTITVNVSDNGKSASFSATVTLPSGTGPFPAVIVYGGTGVDTGTILSSGVAVINYNEYAVGAEGTPRTNKQGAFYTLYGNTSSTGLLMAWAWGVSRIIDVVSQSNGSVLKATAMGVTGCSRFGKGAIVAGAFDQRIALTMPVESGTAGVPILRGVNAEGAQTLSSAYSEQPWFGDAFSPFTGNPNTLPVDTHEVVGLVAPRGLFIMDNPHIVNLGPKSGSVAALGGAEIYKALGAGANISYVSDIQDGTHCAIRPEWTAPLQQNLKKYLLGTGNDPGVFRISSLASGNLAQWRTWTTPTLTGGTSSPPPSSPSSQPSTPPSSPSTPPSTPPSSPSTQPSSPSGTPPSGGCSATVAVNQWQGGFTASVNVTAAAAITGWTVAVTLPTGGVVTNTWNATASGTTGTVKFANVGYDGNVGAGQTTNFGFQGTGTGQGMTVASCTAA
jgi:hypothetical protein